MTAPQRLARIAGLDYLIVAIFGGFAYGYVLAKVYAPGDVVIATTIMCLNDVFQVGALQVATGGSLPPVGLVGQTTENKGIE
jgi:hypothetical protein